MKKTLFGFLTIICLLFSSVSNAQINSSSQWTWMKGDNTINSFGVYGTKAVSAATNKPSGRYAGTTWTDTLGNLWLFGGVGFDVNGNYGQLNDLWKYDVGTNQWTWLLGDDVNNQSGIYGTKGIAASTNKPGARNASFGWVDPSGNLWLLGGNGYDEGGSLGNMNDLWQYNISSGEWIWVSGDNAVNQNGVYGTKGVADINNIPGARYGSASFTDASGNLCFFGGFGNDGSGNSGQLNDLWKYNTATGEWTWLSGDNTINHYGVYGTKGVASSTNQPGSREAVNGWKDPSGNFWIFTGYGYAESGSTQVMNDLWKYNTITNQWSWESGDNTTLQYGVYGTKGIANVANKPGARYTSATWADASGNLWLFGGYGYVTSGGAGDLNDLWKYNTNTGEWTWVSGDNTINQTGIYGTQGVADVNNKPGGRDNSMGWKDTNGNLWLFGGTAYDANGSVGQINDLWKLGIACNISSSSNTQTACNSLVWNGTTYTSSGTYTWTGTNAAGCDSTATLNLTINNSSISSTTTSACDSLIWNGTTYTTSGTYTWGGTNAAGCDSTAALNLIINNSTTSSTSVTSCDSLRWNGTKYTASGTYTYSTTNAVGCDSTATLNLTINNSTISVSTVTVCDSLIWNGTIYRNSGTYTAHFTNAVGCDSTATLGLIVNYKPTVAPIVGLTNIEILAIGGGGGAGGPDGAIGAGGGAGGAVYGAYTLSTTGSSIYTVGVGGAGGYGQGCAGNAAGGTAGVNGGAAGGNAGTGGCSGGGGGSGGWSGLYQGSNYIVVAGGGAGGGGSNEGNANDVTTPGGGNQSAAFGTSMTGQNGTAYSGDGGGGGAGGGGFYGGAGQSNLTQTGFVASQAWGGANYANPTGRNSFATYIGNSGATSSTGTGGQGTTSTISNSSNFNYSNTFGKGGNAQGNGGTSTTANGNNGVVIIRYPGSAVATGGAVTQSGGYTLHTFTATGSNTFTANSGNSVCAGSTTTLNCVTTGGVWSSSDTTIASINASTGLVTGKVAGTVTITYTVTNAQGCIGSSTKQFTVNALPIVPAITGNTTICDNTTTALSNSLTGGIWSSSLTSKATINASTGLVTGVASGSTNITYLYTDNNGCSNTNSTVITINASPTVAAISGNAGVCIGSTTTFSDVTLNGTWTSSNTNAATINNSGLITTVATGSSTISYTVINASTCTTFVTKSITVNALPNVTANATATTVCFGTQTTLTGGNASSYTWNNGVTNGTAFAPSATNSYTVTGTDGNGCVKTANITITVNSLPIVSISPSVTTLCNGYSSTLTASGASTYGWTIVGSSPYMDQVSSTSTLKFAAGLHKLKSSYSGSAIRIRRSSDNTEADFGFSGNDLDVAAISTFIGGGTAYVKTLYDQSGNGNHLSQTSNGNQPTLTLSGLNGKPVIHTNTSQSIYNMTNFTPPFSVVYAARQTGGSRGRLLSGTNNNWLLGWWGGNRAMAHFDGWITSSCCSASDNNIYVYSGTGTGSSSFAYQNKTSITTNSTGGTTGPNGISLNRNEASDADFTDVVEFNSVLSTADRNIVENGMGAYYGLSGFYNTTGASTTVSPNTTSSFTVYGTDGNGCIGTATQAITVNPKPNAGADVNYLCGSATQTLTGTANTGNWTALGTNPIGATLSATTSGVATVSFTNLASGTFSFIYTLPTTNCSDTMSITVRAKPNAGADQAVCILNVATGVTLTSNVAAVWTAKSGNVGTSNIVSAISASTQVNNFSVVGDYNYINTNNGCTDTVKVTVTPAGSIGNYVWKDQNNDGLQNEPTSNGVNGITVDLYKKDGMGAFNLYATTTTANSGSGNPGFYNFGICEDGVYKIKVPTVNPFTQTHLTTQDATAATNGNSDVNPADGFSPDVTIDTHGTGVAKDNTTIDAGYQICTKPIAGIDFTSCGGQLVAITGVSTTPALPTTDGNWAALSSNPSGTILSATNLGVSTIQFDSLASGVYSYIYSVTGGCDDTLNITVGYKPAAGTDLYEICGGSVIPVTGLPSGGTWSQAYANISGATVDATNNGVANISFANIISGIYTFVYTTPFGCTDTMTISTKPKPNAGNDVYMECGTPKLFDSVRATPTGGTWAAMSSNPTGVTLGSTTNGKAQISLPIAPVQGTWSFIYTAPNGCTDTMSYTIGVTGTPAPAINSGSNPICGNSTVQICPTFFGWSNYQWYKNGVAVSGINGTQSCITIDSSKIGSYTLAGTNGSACWSKQSSPVVISLAGAVTPTITIQGGLTTACNNGSVTLISSSTQNNQWNKNGVAISGATSQYYTASTSGVYTVTAINCGYTRTSSGTTITIVAPISISSIQASSGSVCTGSTLILSSATTGGVWTSSNPSKATVNAATGIVTGLNAGSTIITYTVTVSGCSNATSYALSVVDGSNITTPTISVQGSTILCGTATVQLCTGTFGWSNYQWYKNGVAVTTGTGTCITVDTSKLGSYTLAATTGSGCWSPLSNAVTISSSTVLPSTPTISATGSTTVCNNGTVVLSSNATTNNQWKKDDVTISGATSQSYTASTSGVYTVSVSNCAGSSVSVGITVTIVPTITLGSIQSATSSVCKNATVTLTNSTTGGLWASNNNSKATVNATTGAVTGVDTGSVIISYTVIVSGCSKSVSTTLTVVDGSNMIAPVIAAQGQTSLCGTSTVQICPTTFGFSNYQWYKDGIAVTSNGASACITIDTSKLGSYTLAATNGSGCWSTVSDAVVVSASSIPVVPTISTSGSGTICNGGTITLTSSSSTGNQWKKDGVAISGATSQFYTASASGVYTVTVTNCGSAISTGTSITVVSYITINSIQSITGTVCKNATSTLINTTTGGVWSSSNNSIATVNSSTGVLTGVDTGTVTITYTVTISGCSNSVQATFTIVDGSNIVAPTIIAQSSSVICSNGNVTICPTVFGWSNYQWYKNGIALTNNGAGACITVDTSKLGSYTLAATTGTCWSSQSNAITVSTLLAPATPTISAGGSTTLCNGGNVVLTSNAPSGNQWNKDGVVISGATSATYIITTAGVYTATVTNCGGSSTSAGTTVSIAAPITVAAIGSSSSNVCMGSTVTLTNATVGGVWSSSNTSVATINSSGIVTTVGVGTAVISYTVTAGSCSNATTYTLTVQSGSVATPTLDIRGSVNICGSGSLQMCPLVWGYSNYQWYKDGVAYSTASCITVNTAGSYTLTGTNGSGCWSAQSAPALVTINPIPTIVATAGPTAVCAGFSIALVNSSTIPSGGTGVWSTGYNSQVSVGATTGVVSASNAGNVVIKYTVISAVGCTNYINYNVTINAIPSVPSITYAPGTINPQAGAPTGSFCANRTFTVVGTPSGGVWSKTGVINVTTPGGVVTTGNIVGAGTLKYTYTDANGCSNSRTMVGNVYVCAARGINTVDGQLSTVNSFTMYPNPAKSQVSINVETLVGTSNIIVTDLYGKVVKSQTLSMGTNTINISKLSAGMYFVSIITSEGKQTKKLIIE